MADQRETFIRDRLVPAVMGEYLANAADIADLNIDELNANISEALHRALRDDELTELRHFLDDLTISTRVIDMDNADSPFLLESGYHMPDGETTNSTDLTNSSPSSQTTVRSDGGLAVRATGPSTARLLPQSTLVAFKIDSITFGADAADQELVRWFRSGRYIALRVDADGDLLLTDGTNTVYPSGIRTLRVPVQTGDEIVLGMFPDTTNGTKLDVAYTINGQSENIVTTTFNIAGRTDNWVVEFGGGNNVVLSSLRAIAHSPDDAFYPSHGFLAGLAGEFDTNYVLGLVSENHTTRHSIQIDNLDGMAASLPLPLRQFLEAMTIDATTTTTVTRDRADAPFDVATGLHTDGHVLEDQSNISPGSAITVTNDATSSVAGSDTRFNFGEHRTLDGAVVAFRVDDLPRGDDYAVVVFNTAPPDGPLPVGYANAEIRLSDSGAVTIWIGSHLRYTSFPVPTTTRTGGNITIPGVTASEGDVVVLSFRYDDVDPANAHSGTIHVRYSIGGTTGETSLNAVVDQDLVREYRSFHARTIGRTWIAGDTPQISKVRFISTLPNTSDADYPTKSDLAGYADHLDTFYTLGLVSEGTTTTTTTINSVDIEGLQAPEATIDDGSIGLPQLSAEVKAQIAAAANSQFSQAQVDEVKQFLADLDITTASSNDDSATDPFTLAQGYHMPSDETSDTTSPTNDSPSSARVPASRTLGGGRYVRVSGDYNPLNTVLAFRVDSITYGTGTAHQVLAAFRLGDSDTVVECRVDANGDLLFTDGANDAYATGFTTTRVRVSAGDEIALAFRSDDGSHLTAIYSINGLNENDVQTEIDNPTATAFNIDFGVDEDATLSKCRAISAPSALSPTHSFLTGLAQHIDTDYTLGLVSRTTTTTESVAIANLELAADSVAETMLASAVRTKLNATGGGAARSWTSGKFSVSSGGLATIEVPNDMTIGDFTRCAIIYAPTSATNDTTGNTTTTNNKLIFEEVPTPILSGSGAIYTQGLGRGANNISLRITRQADAGTETSFTCQVVDLNTSTGDGVFNTGHIGGVWWY